MWYCYMFEYEDNKMMILFVVENFVVDYVNEENVVDVMGLIDVVGDWCNEIFEIEVLFEVID